VLLQIPVRGPRSDRDSQMRREPHGARTARGFAVLASSALAIVLAAEGSETFQKGATFSDGLLLFPVRAVVSPTSEGIQLLLSHWCFLGLGRPALPFCSVFPRAARRRPISSSREF
jgi:hypothetical protein